MMVSLPFPTLDSQINARRRNVNVAGHADSAAIVRLPTQADRRRSNAEPTRRFRGGNASMECFP